MNIFQNPITRLIKTRCFRTMRAINAYRNEQERKEGKGRLTSYPVDLNIVPTKRCNLRCAFCVQYETEGAQELSLANFKTIAKRLFPYARMAHFVSGGEPFLNKNFMNFLSLCRDDQLPCRVSTNGMLLTDEICRDLAQNPALKILRFSFDGAHKETIQRLRAGTDYERVIAHMRAMTEAKKRYQRHDLKILIRCAVMKSNIEELPQLIHKAADWGMDELQVCYLNVANEMDKGESLFYAPELTQRIFTLSTQIAREEKIPLILPDSLTEEKPIKPCRFPWEFIKIDPDGSVRFCYKAWDHPVGNILAEDFRVVWNNAIYQQIRKRVNTMNPYFKYCKICSWRCGYTRESSHIQYLHNDLYDFDRNFCTPGEKGNASGWE